jgi:hypothetical protein
VPSASTVLAAEIRLVEHLHREHILRTDDVVRGGDCAATAAGQAARMQASARAGRVVDGITLSPL